MILLYPSQAISTPIVGATAKRCRYRIVFQRLPEIKILRPVAQQNRLSPKLAGSAEAGVENVRNTDTDTEAVLIGGPQLAVVPDLVESGMAQRGAQIFPLVKTACQVRCANAFTMGH